MAQRFRKTNLDESLDTVLRELKEDMDKTLGKASFSQAQRELAFGARQFGLNKFRRKDRDLFFK